MNLYIIVVNDMAITLSNKLPFYGLYAANAIIYQINNVSLNLFAIGV